MKKTLSRFVITSPKKLFCPLLVMGQLSLAVQAVAFEDIVYSPDVTKIRNVQLDTTQTQRVVTETDYINWYGAGDNGYSRLRENKDALTQQLIDKFSGYSLEEKKEILRQLRSSGGIHFHAILQDRQGVHNYYEYSLNIDPDAITPDTLEHYLKTSVDQFHNTFRNYVENKEGEGWALIDYLKLTAIAPSVNQRHPLSSDFADALGIEGLDPESQGGQQKQLALLNQMLDEAGEHGGDITRSPTFVNAAYQLAEKSPGFTEMTEANQQTAAAEAGKAISYWIKQHRINGITRAQNKLKDNPITPDVLFLQELADTMGVSPRSLPALASKKNWEGKSAFEHLSSEGALYQFLNALVPDREHYDGGGNVGSPIGYRDNSNRKGHSKQQIIDIFYTGLDVVDEAKKSAFLHGLDLVFDKSYGSIGAPAVADQTSGLNYDSLPEFMRDLPSYFVKTREQLATDARKKFQFLEAKKQSIANDTEAQFNARYDAFKQANPDAAPGSVPDLDQLGLIHNQRSEIEGKGQQFFDQLIAASDKDDFKALSTNTERTLTAIATLFETFVPGVGSLVAAPLHASAGNWTEFGTNLAIGLADVASLGASKMATTVGKQATKLALTSGKSAAEAAKAGQEAATAFLRSSRIRAVDISAIAIGSAAEAYDFGQGIDALLNANTPVERRQAIIGLIATSVMAAPTPAIYTARKLNKIRNSGITNSILEQPLVPLLGPDQSVRVGANISKLEGRQLKAARDRGDGTYTTRHSNTTYIKSSVDNQLYSLNDLILHGNYMPQVVNWHEIPLESRAEAYEAILFRNKLLTHKYLDREEIYRNIRGFNIPEYYPFYDEATESIYLLKGDTQLQNLAITAGSVYGWNKEKICDCLTVGDNGLFSTQQGYQIQHFISDTSYTQYFLNMKDENVSELFNSETNQWINSIVEKNNQFVYSEGALAIPVSERNYTQVVLQSKLAYMDNANNVYLEKNNQYTDASWKKFIKNSKIKIKGSGKNSVRHMIKDLYFESETFRRLFNYNQSKNKTLEIIYPSNNTHHVPNNYENAPNYHQVHLQEIPVANGLGIHSVLSHELVHAFAALDDYPRHNRFLLTPTDRNNFKETFPGPTELVNHKISEEMEMNNIGAVYTLRPYGDKGRLYNAPHVR